MEYLALIIIAIIPGIALTFYFKKKDHIQPEPWSVINISFVLGVIAVIPVAFFENWILDDSETSGNAMVIFLPILIKVALVEELAKIIVFLTYPFRNQHFDELMDGIVYGAAVAAGFATLENIYYVIENGFLVGFMRALLSVPMHILAGALSGYWIARMRFGYTTWPLAILLGPGMAILAHTLFDVGMFAGSALWFLIGFMVVPALIVALVLHCRRGLKESMGEALSQPIIQELKLGPDKQPYKLGRLWDSLTVLSALLYSLSILSTMLGLFFLLGFLIIWSDGTLDTYGTFETIILLGLVLIPLGGGPFFFILGRRFGS